MTALIVAKKKSFKLAGKKIDNEDLQVRISSFMKPLLKNYILWRFFYNVWLFVNNYFTINKEQIEYYIK